MLKRVKQALQWLGFHWRADATEVARQYSVAEKRLKALFIECPLAMADLAQWCCLFEDVYDEDGTYETYLLIGRRQAMQHLATLAGLNHDDLAKLKEELEHAARRNSSRDADRRSTELDTRDR